MTTGFFITGTDTHIGKTTIACRLLTYLNQQHYRTQAIKPIASGCQQTPTGWHNEDALALQAHASLKLPYAHVNPIAMPAAISPNFAAAQQHRTLSANTIVQATQAVMHPKADCIVVEGAGGWLVPINDTETMADVAIGLKLPVIVVIGLRLGCLNHTLLTIAQLQRSGVTLAGWVANCIDPKMAAQRENITYLTQRLPCPRLAIAEYQPHATANQPLAEPLRIDHPLPMPIVDPTL